MKYSEIEQLTTGQLIIDDKGIEMYKFLRKRNNDLYEFATLVFSDENDMDGHFDENEITTLTKNELMRHYKIYE